MTEVQPLANPTPSEIANGTPSVRCHALKLNSTTACNKADPQSESGIANAMRNKTQRNVRPTVGCGASYLRVVNAKSTRRRGGITRGREVSLA